MIKDRGIDALVNECLIGPVLSMGATFIAYACALLAYLYLIFTSPAYNADGGYTPVVVAFAFLIGLQICKFDGRVVSDGRLLTISRQNLHDAVEQRYRHDFCCHGVGPRCPHARAPGPLPPHGSCVPTGPAGHPRLGSSYAPSRGFWSASGAQLDIIMFDITRYPQSSITIICCAVFHDGRCPWRGTPGGKG